MKRYTSYALVALALVLAPVILFAQAPPAGNFSGGAFYRPNGTDVAIADGGTGQSTATAAFDALAPTTTQGDMIYHNGTDNVRLAKGTALQLLRMNAGATAPEWAAAAASGDVTGPASSTADRIVTFNGTTGKVIQESTATLTASTLNFASSFGLARAGTTLWSCNTSQCAANSGYLIQGDRFNSLVATGTAPITVASTTKVANLNVDTLDGIDSTGFLAASRLIEETDSLSFAALAANECDDTTTTVTGVAAGTSCTIAPTNGSMCANMASLFAWGSAADTVTVRACASGAGGGCLTITNQDHDIRCTP